MTVVTSSGITALLRERFSFSLSGCRESVTTRGLNGRGRDPASLARGAMLRLSIPDAGKAVCLLALRYISLHFISLGLPGIEPGLHAPVKPIQHSVTYLQNFVGMPGIEPGLHAPEARVLPVYYIPTKFLKSLVRVLPVYYSSNMSSASRVVSAAGQLSCRWCTL